MSNSHRSRTPQPTLAPAEPVVDLVAVYAKLRKRDSAIVSALSLLALFNVRGVVRGVRGPPRLP